jgi:hypothetical protein
MVLVHGLSAVFRIALAALIFVEDDLIACTNFETIVRFLQKTLPERASESLDEVFLSTDRTAILNHNC